MAKRDVFDYLGWALVALIAALWVAHFVLPAPPPDPSRDVGKATLPIGRAPTPGPPGNVP